MAPNSVRQSTKFKANCPHNGPKDSGPGPGPSWLSSRIQQAKCLIILRLRNFCLVTNSSLFRHIKSLNVNAFIISSHVSLWGWAGAFAFRFAFPLILANSSPTSHGQLSVSLYACLSSGAWSPQHAWVILTDRQSVKGNTTEPAAAKAHTFPKEA